MTSIGQLQIIRESGPADPSLGLAQILVAEFTRKVNQTRKPAPTPEL